MKKVRTDAYHYPPRGMDRIDAARYVGLGVTKFDQLVADRRMPQPVRIDGRVIWDRVKLDMAFSDLGGDNGENQIDAVLARSAAQRALASGAPSPKGRTK